MSQQHGSRRDYCEGCGGFASGNETSNGSFYCNSCWNTAYLRQQQQREQQQKYASQSLNYITPPRKSRSYVNVDDFRALRSRKSISSSSHKQQQQQQQLSFTVNKSNQNKIEIDDLQQQILLLTQKNTELSAQLSVAMGNNNQLQQENELLNNLGDGIEKYDYMKLKEENNNLMDDAERLSLRTKHLMIELKKLMKQNNNQQITINNQKNDIQQLHEKYNIINNKYKEQQILREIAEKNINSEQDVFKYQLNQKNVEIEKLKKELQELQQLKNKTNFNQYSTTKINVKKSAQIFGDTVNYKKKNKGNKKNERGSNGWNESNKSNKEIPTTPRRKTRCFKKKRHENNANISCIDNISNIKSTPLINHASSESKSALNVSGYADLQRTSQVLLNRKQSTSQQQSIMSVNDISTQKSLPKFIGMRSREPSIEFSDNETDTEIESLYDTMRSREATPTSSVSTPRTFKAKSKHKRKPKGKSFRTTHEVMRDINTQTPDVFRQQSIEELQELRQGSGGNVREKAKKYQQNTKYQKYVKYYPSSNYVEQIMSTNVYGVTPND